VVSWVQGQREVAEARASVTWMELLYRRVTRDFDAITSGPKTSEAEQGLGIQPSTYFYVERPHPHFGDSVVAFMDSASDYAAAVPFDSGGLWHGHVPLIDEMTAAQKSELLHRWSFTCPDYQLPFAQWVDEAIGGLGDYRVDVAPTGVLPPEIDLSTASSQSWTWEARLRKNVGAGESIQVSRVYLMDGRRSVYLSWLRDQRWLARGERLEHLRWVAEHVEETPNPVDEMINYLASS